MIPQTSARMRSTFLLILGLGLSDSLSVFPPATVCQAGWSTFNGKCYKYHSEAKSWEDAEATCLGYQGDLVSIHDTEENDFLFNTFGPTRFWIGGRRTGDGWIWSDGTNWNFQDWFSKQPSGDGGCSEILDDDPSQGTWNDLSCTRPLRPFVCQILTDSTTSEQVVELSLEFFGTGHAGVVQRTAFRPLFNQAEITVPAHGDGEFLALDVVIQGLGGEDQVTDPYLLTVKEKTCFLNHLPEELDPSRTNPTEASSGNTGIIAKKHLIQTSITRIYEDTADYEELADKIRNKCEGKEIFRGGYKFLSQEQYEESMETENFIGDSQSSTNHFGRRKREGPECMTEYKCTYDGGHGCFYFEGTHIYDGQREKCVCCKRNCPCSTIGNDCNCRDLRAETFLKCYNSQNLYGIPYPTEDTCASPTLPVPLPQVPVPLPHVHVPQIPFSPTICITDSGASAHKPCIFPFRLNGMVYTSCTLVSAHLTEHKPWCSTEVDESGHHIGGQGKWGNCGSGCPIPPYKDE